MKGKEKIKGKTSNGLKRTQDISPERKEEYLPRLKGRPRRILSSQASWPVTDTDTTARKSIKQVLEEPEDPFRMVTQAISDWVYAYRVEPGGRITWDWITPGFTTVTGYRTDEFGSYAELAKIVHPEDRHLAEERLKYIKAIRPYVSEHRIITKKGEICWVRNSINPAADPLHPGTIKVIGAAQDITERKRAENKLAYLASFPERNPNPVIEVDLDGNVRYMNPAALHLFPDLFEQGLGHPWLTDWATVVRPFRKGQVSTGDRDVKFGERSYQQAFHYIAPDRLLRIYGFDITEQKKAEEALRKAHGELEARVRERTAELEKAVEALGAERQRFNTVLETLPAYLVLLTPDYHVPFANRFFRERFGEAHGRPCFEYLFGRSEPCEICETYTALKTMAPHEWEWIGPDGRNYYVFDFPFTDLDGSTLILEMGIDITERKRAEEQLKESEKKLRYLSSELLTAQEGERKRIAGELHDSIAASLTAVKFTIERTLGQMGQGTGTPDLLRRLISTVQQTIEETRRIMADLRPAVLDDLGIIAVINWFCREFQKTYSHVHVEKQIGLSESDVPDSLKTSIYRISQEAMNNIAKHSQASLVNLSLRKDEGRIELTIQDNGRGFDPDHATRGLGFSTMRERTELSGGTYTIESIEGKGTVIRASWPR